MEIGRRWMHRLMIVHDFDLIRMTVSPLEADTPLVVDANAVLPFPRPAKFFESIGGRGAQITQRRGVVKHPELAQGYLLNLGRESARPLTGEDFLGLTIPKGLDHDAIL